MRRVLAITLVALAGLALLIVGSGAGGDDDAYEVRAVFDNAGFLVPGEEVRVAGANVGVVRELDISGTDEPVRENGEPDPGKAVVVMEITDPAFQDFREDASCLIRPQSLIGEKYVECEPTQPRAAGTEPPPELAEIPDGELGEGQRLLPLERNGKAVDLDLVNNIMDEPYPDRFRLIFNDLGAGLAARGEELAEIVERSNPALRETNEVLAILARQNRALAGLASDSDRIFSALAAEREHLASFINEATVAGQATAERREDLEESFARFPGFLRELRATMVELNAFNVEAEPLFSDLRGAAPSLTRINELLEPFSNQGTRAFTTLGTASEESTEPFVQSDPVIRDIRGAAERSVPAARNLSQLLTTMRKTGGFEGFFNTIYGLGGAVNAFDQYGHLVRALIPLNVCFDYYSGIPNAGCEAFFANALTESSAEDAMNRFLRAAGVEDGGKGNGRRADEADESGGEAEGFELDAPEAQSEPEAEAEEAVPAEPETEIAPDAEGLDAPEADSAARARAMRDLIEFMVGDAARTKGGGR